VRHSLRLPAADEQEKAHLILFRRSVPPTLTLVGGSDPRKGRRIKTLKTLRHGKSGAGSFLRLACRRAQTGSKDLKNFLIILRNCSVYPIKIYDFWAKCLKTLLDFLGNIRYNGIKVG
jgi:hypothetical protein